MCNEMDLTGPADIYEIVLCSFLQKINIFSIVLASNRHTPHTHTQKNKKSVPCVFFGQVRVSNFLKRVLRGTPFISETLTGSG